MEQPPSAMSWLQEDNIAMLREWCAHVACVSACSHGIDFYKNWAFCASFESIASLASARQIPYGRIPCKPGGSFGRTHASFRDNHQPTERATVGFCRLTDGGVHPQAHETGGRGRHELIQPRRAPSRIHWHLHGSNGLRTTTLHPTFCNTSCQVAQSTRLPKHSRPLWRRQLAHTYAPALKQSIAWASQKGNPTDCTSCTHWQSTSKIQMLRSHRY